MPNVVGIFACLNLLEPEGCIEIASHVESVDACPSIHYWVEIGDCLANYLPFAVDHIAFDYIHNFLIR